MISSIVSIQRNRAQYLKEWVVFHHLVGFRKFYLFLHKCTDNSIEVLDELSKKYDITYMNVADDIETPQLAVYKYAYKEYNHEVDWMAFIDGDEFLFSPKAKNINEILENHYHSKTSALCVYWVCFGSSGHINEPNGLVTENFRYRGSMNMLANRHVKSIVKGRQGSLVDVCQNPHIFFTPLGSYDEVGRLIEHASPDWEPSHETIRINHYVTQSRSFYEANKAIAGTAMDSNNSKILRDENWWVQHDINVCYDDTMNLYIPKLKEICGF